jgi:hypothetical protein
VYARQEGRSDLVFAEAGQRYPDCAVYVDDIVFGGSSNSLVARFADDMSREFEMSMMGELLFFLGIQIKQSKEHLCTKLSTPRTL